jgi:hypothetical protein
MARLWKRNPATPEGKYLVTRRDGTVVEWPSFVIGARDEAAPTALRAYAAKAAELGWDPQYVADLYELALEYESYFAEHGAGDPDAPRHRVDDPATIEKMKRGRSA